MDVCEEVFKIDDRVANDLSRPMVSDVSSAIDVIKRCAKLFQLIRCLQQVLVVSCTSLRKHMRVFAEKKVVLRWLLRIYGKISVSQLGVDYAIEERRLIVPRLLVV